MKKVADGYYQAKETEYVGGSKYAEDVVLYMTIDVIDGEYLDTAIDMEGKFAVAGSRRKEFADKLSALIDEFRI